VEIELGVTWEGLGAWSSKAPNRSVPETSAPNPYLQNIDGSCIILQGFSMSNLSGLYYLSLQIGEGCV
jgi:hypothetical protein